MEPFRLTYDYRCPFAKNIHLHVVEALKGGFDIPVEFIPWTMSQGHRSDDSLDVWDDTHYDGAHLALVTSISVRDHQNHFFLPVHEALFRARHELGRRLASWDEIVDVLTPVGVDLDAVAVDIASRRPHAVLGSAFREMEKFEAFGVPTFVVHGDATFVRFMTPPTSDAGASAKLVESLVTMMAFQPDLNEFKHTMVAN